METNRTGQQPMHSEMKITRLGLVCLVAMFAFAGSADGQVKSVWIEDELHPVELPEVWVYPRGDRPDPVLPPPALYSGEGTKAVEVTVIQFDSEDAAKSRALVRTSVGGVLIRRVVQEGDEIDGFSVLAIEPDRIIVEIETLGAARREALQLVRREARP